jgi:hypothetical protein
MALDVPALWRDERDPGTSMLVVFDPATSPDGHGAAAEVRVRLLRQDPEPGDLGTLVTQRLRNEPSYRQISAGQFGVDGRVGLRHEIEVTLNGVAVRVVEVWLPLPDRLVWFTAIATPARQGTAIPQFNDVIASLRVTR